MIVEVDVTARDIARGGPSCWGCPVARAASRAFHAWSEVWRETLSADGQTYPLPAAARAFVASYDAGEPVAPFRFTLEADAAREINEEVTCG